MSPERTNGYNVVFLLGLVDSAYTVFNRCLRPLTWQHARSHTLENLPIRFPGGQELVVSCLERENFMSINDGLNVALGQVHCQLPDDHDAYNMSLAELIDEPDGLQNRLTSATYENDVKLLIANAESVPSLPHACDLSGVVEPVPGSRLYLRQTSLHLALANFASRLVCDLV